MLERDRVPVLVLSHANDVLKLRENDTERPGAEHHSAEPAYAARGAGRPPLVHHPVASEDSAETSAFDRPHGSRTSSHTLSSAKRCKQQAQARANPSSTH